MAFLYYMYAAYRYSGQLNKLTQISMIQSQFQNFRIVLTKLKPKLAKFDEN